MGAAIHYKLKVKLIRKSEGSNIDFIEDEKVFKHNSPIKARGEAFKSYQSYIDILLQGIEQKYQDHQTTKNLIAKYLVNDSIIERQDLVEFQGRKFRKTINTGIGVFFVIDEPIQDDIFEGKSGDEWIIHGLGDFHSAHDPQILMDGLTHEWLYYEQFEYDTAGKKVSVDFLELEANEVYQETILKTPFDWSTLNTELDFEEEETSEDEPSDLITIEDLIAGGETNQVEFKPTLVYNFNTQKGSIAVKSIIAKTICAFLNSNGGYLLIGVKDDGTVQGLDPDFSLANGKDEKDFFRLEFDQMLQYFLSFSVVNKVSGDFFEIDDKQIFVVTVFPNKRRPIFLKGREGKEFYIRGEASSRPITDMEELVNYCMDRFKK